MTSPRPTLTVQEPKEYDLPRQSTGDGIVLGDATRREQGTPDRQIGACGPLAFRRGLPGAWVERGLPDESRVRGTIAVRMTVT